MVFPHRSGGFYMAHPHKNNCAPIGDNGLQILEKFLKESLAALLGARTNTSFFWSCGIGGVSPRPERAGRRADRNQFCNRSLQPETHDQRYGSPKTRHGPRKLRARPFRFTRKTIPSQPHLAEKPPTLCVLRMIGQFRNSLLRDAERRSGAGQPGTKDQS
jgi:hypothetical protein